MRRGEIWTVSGSQNYYGKPRPTVILQARAFEQLDSVTLCGFTTDPTEAPLFRLMVEPSSRNRLEKRCYIMVDKIQTVGKNKIGQKIGELDDEDIIRLNRTVTVFLDLEGRRSVSRHRFQKWVTR